MRLLFMGPPGVGKGTQAKRFAHERGLCHISTGDMLRQAVQRGTPAGLQAKPVMERGALVSDALVLELVDERLGEPDAAAGFILDGYPRNPRQAADLARLLEQRGEGLDAVVALTMDVEHIVPRLSGRRSCPECGAVYHVSGNPPKEPGRCDRDRAELVQRPDDQEDVIRDRMATYVEQTAPLIAFYRDAGLLRGVSCEGSVDDVAARLSAVLGAAAA